MKKSVKTEVSDKCHIFQMNFHKFHGPFSTKLFQITYVIIRCGNTFSNKCFIMFTKPSNLVVLWHFSHGTVKRGRGLLKPNSLQVKKLGVVV